MTAAEHRWRLEAYYSHVVEAGPEPSFPRRSTCTIVSWGICEPASITITPGRVECRGLVLGPLVHTDPTIVAMRSRYLPWPGATVYVLRGERGRRSSVVPRLNRKWLREAFLDAGFVVQDRNSTLPLAAFFGLA